MKHYLSDRDRNFLEGRIAESEREAGIQLVIATTPRSDSYPEIPWKAFSVTASVAGLAVFIAGTWLARWTDFISILMALVLILGAAALSVILTIVFPAYARLFLSDATAAKETRQHAESLFLSRDLVATAGRNGVLVLLSIFERRVVILRDKGLNEVLSEAELGRIIALMKPFLGKRDYRQAFSTAIDGLIAATKPRKSGEGLENELSDRIIEDKGI